MATLVCLYDSAQALWHFGLVGGDEMKSGAVGLAHLVSGLFTADAAGRAKFADGFVVSSLIGAGQIGAGHLAQQAVLSSQIGSGQVGGEHFNANVQWPGRTLSGTLKVQPVSGQPAIQLLGPYAGAGALYRTLGDVSYLDLGQLVTLYTYAGLVLQSITGMGNISLLAGDGSMTITLRGQLKNDVGPLMAASPLALSGVELQCAGTPGLSGQALYSRGSGMSPVWG